MVTYNKVPASGDPSSRIQSFETLKMHVLCCRYWWLDKWKSYKMTFPYWRLYWNKTPGAYVQSHHKIYLSPDVLIIIPPNTPFSTGIDGEVTDEKHDQYDLVGNWIRSRSEEKSCIMNAKILHLFIHFNLGSQLDHTRADIYRLEISNEQVQLVEHIIDKLLVEGTSFDIQTSLDIYQLILSGVNQLPPDAFETRKMDSRLFFLLDFIEDNVDQNLQNELLAGKMNMATNAFTRFFREQMQSSPQEYVRQLRIARACDLLGHSTLTIDEIADNCGFSDRFHFSKVFKKIKDISPAEYKKKYILSVV
ncbi:MAG: helix-turn-helix domain-containing protein [Bacteroidetes bacterium]|jgi:AraC-like DNA-binding protein|nr:helix-turn-helix domain-containing protein [Bacteroidota bacterium]